MGHLRRIQQDDPLPLSVREAAERLITAVTQQDFASFSSNPIRDARIIIDRHTGTYHPQDRFPLH